MADTLFQFEQGPYNLLDYTIETDEGRVVVELNDGDLGRLPIEDLETVEKLREALDHVEAYLKQRERRKEEL